MGRRIDDTEPTGTPALLDESEPAPPPARYDPPVTDDPELNLLLRRLNPPPAPRPVDLPETDGDLAARYYASARTLGAGGRTPTPEAPVQLACTADIPVAGALDVPLERVAPRQRDPRRDAPTVEIPIVRPRPSTRLFVAIVLGASFAIGVVAIVVWALTADPETKRDLAAKASPSITQTPSSTPIAAVAIANSVLPTSAPPPPESSVQVPVPTTSARSPSHPPPAPKRSNHMNEAPL
jgi:hypothetical protein